MANVKRKVIIITDGDNVARKVVEAVAAKVGGRCISLSGGNPTPLSGEEIVSLINKAPFDPVLVMFDDNGNVHHGAGESALEQVARHPDVDVIGALAVASHALLSKGAPVDAAIDNQGNILYVSVNKEGEEEWGTLPVIHGDTVDVLNKLNIPVIVGIGDIGKMHGHDDIRLGAPITTKAVQMIMERSSCSLH